MRPRTLFFAAVVSVGLLGWLTIGMLAREDRTAKDCKDAPDCKIMVTVDPFLLRPSVDGAQVVVIKKGKKITWELDSKVYNFATTGIRFEVEEGKQRKPFECERHSPRKITCQNDVEGPTDVQVYKYGVDVKWLPLLDPWVVRI